MNNLKYILPFFSLVICFSPEVKAQKLLENTRAYLGFSWQEQDRRLFESKEAETIPALEDSNWDYETNLYLQKRLLKWWHFGFSSGLGYMRYQTKFSRPIQHNYFASKGTKVGTTLLEHIGRYVNHKVSIPTSIEFYVDKKEKMFLNLTGWASFNFNKYLVGLGGQKYGNKFKLEFNSLELNPGFGFKVQHFSFQFNYRALNYYKIDKVIFNNLLFTQYYNYHDPFLDKKYEHINWDKMWITVGYDLSNLKR